jgi:hypothetical protein
MKGPKRGKMESKSEVERNILNGKPHRWEQ